tara:strand:- start:387 stop:629 length:243 start_codon:yes stop_codon:yes gene_type:complete
MEHFIRVIFNTAEDISEALNESVFPGNEWMETDTGGSVMNIPLPRHLTEEESDEFAQRLAEYMFEQGHDNFDIEVSMEDN